MNVNLAFGKPSRKLSLANTGLENFSLSKTLGQERKEHTYEKEYFYSVLPQLFFFLIRNVLSYQVAQAGGAVSLLLAVSRGGGGDADTARWHLVALPLKPQQICFTTKPPPAVSDLLRL